MEETALVVGDIVIKMHGRLVRIARIEGDKYEFLNDPVSVIAQLQTCRTRIDLFTFMQRIPETKPKYSYPMEWDNLAAVPISTFDTWWTGQADATVRNKVRKAQKKDVKVCEVPFDDNFIRGISHIYNETPIRQGRRFRHYGKGIEEVRQEEGTFRDNSIFLGAFFDGTMIGFAKLVRDSTGTQAGLMNILSLIKHRDKAPTNALVAEAIRCCANSGISYLVYSNFTYGNKQRDSLSEFKRHNGFKQIDLPRYYVPLTATGRLAYRLCLHHKWTDRLPRPIVTTIRELRNLWHNRRLRISTEVSR